MPKPPASAAMSASSSASATARAVVAAAIGLAIAAMGLVALAAFWPGILSEDSLDQWSQLLAFRFSAYHPPVHTLTYWVITRAWLSPAAVAVAQTLALSVVIWAVARACLRAGAPLTLALATGVALLITPAVSVLAVTLWKDALYSVCLLWLSLVCWHVAATRGDALQRPAILIALALSLAGVGLYRHNGLPVAAATGLWLLAAGPAGRRVRIAATLGGAAVLVAAGLTLPARLLTIEPVHPMLRHQAPLHQTAALIDAGVYLPPADLETFTALMPRDTWRANYDCRNAGPLLWHLNYAAFVEREAAFEAAWLRAVLHHPRVVAAHVGCVSGFIWNPWAQPHAFISMGIAANKLGLTTAPLVPQWNGRFWQVYLHTLPQPILRAVLWGPVLHLAIVVACAAAGWWRLGHRAVLPFVPAILHTLVLIPVIPSSEYRLQFPVVLIGLVSPLLLAGLLAASRRAVAVPAAD
jgi:hypothetical protein